MNEGRDVGWWRRVDHWWRREEMLVGRPEGVLQLPYVCKRQSVLSDPFLLLFKATIPLSEILLMALKHCKAKLNFFGHWYSIGFLMLKHWVYKDSEKICLFLIIKLASLPSSLLSSIILPLQWNLSQNMDYQP